uniref:Uncharacterized protein n=1 Tax=Physcomitrium patens TaxID=3218 RepID=A0A2K1KGV8_PHYPA|nr:hypothetical protein PHYPA_009380 [Physcomitrium patens]
MYQHAQSLSRKLRQAMFVASELVKNRNLQVKKIIENLLVNYKHAHIGCTEMQKYVDIRDLDRHFVCVVPAPAQCQKANARAVRQFAVKLCTANAADP